MSPAINPVILAIVSLRAAALAAAAAGQGKAAAGLYAAADLLETGRATDEHMAAVAEKLKSRTLTPADWLDVTARLEEETKRLNEPPPAQTETPAQP